MIEYIILNGDSADLLVISAIGFLAGLYAIYWGFKMYRQYQLIRDIPTSDIQSMSLGTAEVKGTVKSSDENYVYSNPLEDEKCVYYTREVEEYNPSDDGSDWDTVLEETVGEEFYVDDGTGKVLVKAEEPDCYLEDDAETVEKIRYDPDEEEVPLALQGVDGVRGSDIVPDFLEGSEKYRVTVEAISLGMNVYLLGHASRRNIEDSFASNEKNIQVGNAEKSDISGSSLPFLGTSKPFIISNQGEKELIKQRKWLAPASFFGGLIISAVSLWYILVFFGF